MALKPRTKRKITWAALLTLAVVGLGVVMLPQMVTLNYLKPRLAAAITEQTGMATMISGDVHFSLLGRATIVANRVRVPIGTIRAAMFSVPLRYLARPASAPLTGPVTLYGANVEITRLSTMDFDHDLKIRNSTVHFLGKDYEIINGEISRGRFRGIVRTDQHKYEIDYDGDEFVVRNHNNDLTIRGVLYPDGAARGEMSLQTDDVNRWFEFSEPKIDIPVRVSMDFDWDGGYGVRFTNIRGENFGGSVDIFPDGRRDIKLRGRDIVFDFSFLTDPTRVFIDTTFDLDLYGRLKLGPREFKHLKIQATGTRHALQISNIVADDITVSGGTIDADGAHNLMIVMPMDGRAARCNFSGTPDAWDCREFTYGDIGGTISVRRGVVTARIASDAPMPDMQKIADVLGRFAKNGRVAFEFADAAGTLYIKNGRPAPQFTAARGRPLEWAGLDLPFLPASMRTAVGDFEWRDGALSFAPANGGWKLTADGGRFTISGDNAKQWLPNLDLAAVADTPYTVTGRYRRGAVSDLKIDIAGQTFTGTAARDAITLKTDTLNIDAFINQDYIDNYEELQFLGPSPVMQMFDLPVKISLTADTVIYNGDEFKNFVYALQPAAQIFSISDNARGAMLATIEKDKSAYDISIQLNRFQIRGALLSADMPLNVRDAVVTAEIALHTSGNIAHDITYNMAGTVDMSFYGGVITGLGIDGFYAAAPDITTLNAEYALGAALESGMSRIKEMHVSGTVDNHGFKTDAPITLALRHADASGTLDIRDGQMYAEMDLVLRGTAPAPVEIMLNILPDGGREYSTSDIMREFDADFMRAFIKTHDRF